MSLNGIYIWLQQVWDDRKDMRWSAKRDIVFMFLAYHLVRVIQGKKL